MAETASDHLVVIDMQDHFLEDKDSEEVDSVIKEINNIIHSFRELGLPITFCVYNPMYLGHTSTRIDLVEGDFIIAKWENNAFTSKAFEKRVQSSNRLILTGCNLEFCVRETADHAAEMGFEVIIPRDAVLSRDTLSFRKLHTHLRFLLNGIKLVRHKEM